LVFLKYSTNLLKIGVNYNLFGDFISLVDNWKINFIFIILDNKLKNNYVKN